MIVLRIFEYFSQKLFEKLDQQNFTFFFLSDQEKNLGWSFTTCLGRRFKKDKEQKLKILLFCSNLLLRGFPLARPSPLNTAHPPPEAVQ